MPGAARAGRASRDASSVAPAHRSGKARPVILGLAGAIAVLKLAKREEAAGVGIPRPAARWLQWGLAGLTAATIYVIYRVMLKGGFEVDLILGVKVHARSLLKPFLFLAFLGAVALAVKKWLRPGPLLGKRRMDPVAWTLLLILLLAFWMTFGTSGPYLLFSRVIPGFEGLRAAARSHVFVMMPLALFAAFGLRLAAERLKAAARAAVLTLAPLVILAEYLSIPVTYQSIPVKAGIPSVYRWLASQRGDFALLEFPLPQEGRGPGALECPRIYYSAYHWKRLVNGFSGYIPPLYDVLQDRWDGQAPLSRNLHDLRSLGVRYLIIHTSQMPGEAVPYMKQELAAVRDQAAFVGEFGEALVYEVTGWRDGLRELRRPPPALRMVERRGWRVSASVNEAAAGLALDGDSRTRWDTAGRQERGQFFAVDLGREVELSMVRLEIAESVRDYPRGYLVEVSPDGRAWKTVAQEGLVFLDIRAYLNPKRLSLEIPLSPTAARWVRIVGTGSDPVYYWSIHELEIYAPPGRVSPARPSSSASSR